MAPLVKPPTEGDLLKLDIDKNYTREVVMLVEGTAYPLGTILGQFTAGDDAGKYGHSPDAAADPDVGSQLAAGVLLHAVDATDAERTAVIIKRGPVIVARGMLVFDASVDDETKRAAKLAQLTALGIVARQDA